MIDRLTPIIENFIYKLPCCIRIKIFRYFVFNQCGALNIQQYIINGKETVRNNYPWMVKNYNYNYQIVKSIWRKQEKIIPRAQLLL